VASARQVLRRLLELHRIDVDALEKTFATDAAAGVGHDGSASQAYVDAMIGGAIERIDDPAFGLRAARCWHPTYFGVLGHAWLVSPTLRDGLERLSTYYRLVGDRGVLEVEDVPGGVKARYWSRRGHPAALPVAATVVDIVMSILLDMCRFNAGDGLRPIAASLRRHAPPQPEVYERFFGCPVTFDSPENTIVLSERDARMKLPSTNRRLAGAFDRWLADELAHVRKDDIAGRCRAALTHSLPGGVIGVADVAETLHMTPRTLQRHLADARTSFQALLDEVRRELALEQVEDPRRSLTETAFMLGFNETSSFTRAFKRWTGVSPSAYRARLSAGVPDRAVSMSSGD
jgi:AraC-like DNA-binding protein